MCGIAGYFQFQGEIELHFVKLIQNSLDQIRHRGPDAEGIYTSPDRSCILGSRRLSIIDRSSAANQPMANEDETVWLVFNGEIYNYVHLRESLVKKGHRFRSLCDTEVILHLYEDYGPALLDHLDGIFSFVLYDVRKRTLFGARDRLGVKPLYYALSSYRFAFASEPKALFALPDVSREPGIEELASYLTFSCVPGPRTLFRDIEKLEPGMQFELQTDGIFRQERYWTPFEKLQDPPVESEEFLKILGESIQRAVAKRMVSDVPVGATLSGGIDSSLIVSLMSEFSDEPVKTFTVGYPGDDKNPHSDLHYARIVSRRFGTDHHEIILTPDDVLALLDQDVPLLADDPIGSPSEGALAGVARSVRNEGVGVIQVGEGSDELFCGYNPVHKLWRFHERLKFLRYFFPRSGMLPYWGYGVVFSMPELEQLFKRPLFPQSNPYERLKAKVTSVSEFRNHSYLDQLTIIDLLLQLPERLLMRVDKATMLHGVEAREPFLDREVLRTAFTIPPKWRALGQKGFLKMYAKSRLPPEILERPKVGFPARREVFMAPPVLSRIREGILEKHFVELTGFDPLRMQNLIASCEKEHHYFHHVWSLYILSVWFHRWVV